MSAISRPTPTWLYQITKSFPQKLGRALLVMAERRPAILVHLPTTTYSGDFTHVHCFYLLSIGMLDSFCSIPKCLTTHLSYPLVFVNGVPCAFIAKTKSNQSQGLELTLLKVPHSCLISRYRWEGRCLRFKTPTFKPCHVLRWD